MSWLGVLNLFRSFSLNISKSNVYRGITVEKMPFYAVARGRTPGIFMTWADCEAQVKGFSGARYKKFDAVERAQDFILAEGGGAGGGGSASKNTSTASKNTSTASKQKTQNNLKRSYSTSASNFQRNSGVSKPKPKSKPGSKSNDDDNMSDNSELDESLNTIIIKQMDDIEERLTGFGKGIDKIIKKNTLTPTKTAQRKSVSKAPQQPSSQRKTILIEPPQPKKRKSTNTDFEVDEHGFVQVYTDGACSANGRSGAKAGYGVYWGEGHPLNVSEPVSGRATNNCGEIQAASCAIRQALQNGVTNLTVNTDSKFVINAITKWIRGWKKNGWRLKSGEPVKNEVDFKELDALQDNLVVKWNYVEAHRGVHGNEMADQLAKAGAAKYSMQ